MFDGSDPCWKPSYNWSRDTEPRLQISQFGDGYLQRCIDGINPNKVSWNLNFNGRHQAVIYAMASYLGGLKGFSFPFLDPLQNKVLSVFCDKWTVSIGLRKPNGTWIGNLTAVFYTANDGEGLNLP